MAPLYRLLRIVSCLSLVVGLALPAGAQSPLTQQRGVREKDPVLSADGQDLYFTRPDHPRNQGTDATADVWVRHRTPEGGWGRPLNPGSPINSFRDDRLLSASVDGNSLAVLRTGKGAAVLEQLTRSGRTWRITDRWLLPEDVDAEDLTFNTNSQRLIYVRQNAATASLDLYQRVARSDGKWSSALPLPALSGSADERHPLIASDGRTLYFRRPGGQWMRQLDRGAPPEVVDLPTRYLQLAQAPGITIATTDDLGGDERLTVVAVSETSSLPAGRLVYDTAAAAPVADQPTVEVPLSTGNTLAVRPDGLRSYAVVLRPGEVARDLQQTRAEKQEEVEEYRQLRPELYTRTSDREQGAPYERVRAQPRRSSAIPVDTVPPTAAENSRDRYAREMAELERMKEKFRRQQERKMRERDRSSKLGPAWYAEPDTLPVAARNGLLPPNSRDTTVLRSTVRSGLYPAQPADPGERRSWEHRVQGTVAPPSGNADAGELDAEYAEKLREVEALRTQLRQAREPQLTSKSPDAPVEEANAPRVTFITNTAYPNSGGYLALDGLVAYVQQAARVVEIRIHTSGELSARAAQILSEERATTVRNYLRDAGIAPENFRVVGYGNHESAAGERVEIIR